MSCSRTTHPLMASLAPDVDEMSVKHLREVPKCRGMHNDIVLIIF